MANQVIQKIVALYDYDNENFGREANALVQEYFEKLPAPRSEKDPLRLNSKSVFYSHLKKALVDKIDPMELPNPTNAIQRSFNEMTLAEQLAFKKQYKNMYEWLDNIRLLPENLDGLDLTEQEKNDNMKRNLAVAKAKLRKEMETYDVGDIMKRMFNCMNNLNGAKSVELIGALLLATGRRMIEVLSCGSFYLTPDMSPYGYRCMFSGQAKSANQDDFEIPLLAPANYVFRAFDRMRDLCGTVGKSQNFCNEKYSGIVNRYTKKMAGCNAHGLRALYAISCWNLLKGRRMSLMGYLPSILGHSNSASSMAYQRVQATITDHWVPATIDVQPQKNLNLKADTMPEEKRIAQIEQFMDYKLPITQSALKRMYGGTPEIWKRILELNKDSIKVFNESLKI